MKETKNISYLITLLLIVTLFVNCNSDDSGTTDDTDGDTDEVGITELSSAFDEFSDAVTVTLSDDGTEIYIETTGYPDHTSIYWNPDDESGLLLKLN